MYVMYFDHIHIPLLIFGHFFDINFEILIVGEFDKQDDDIHLVTLCVTGEFCCFHPHGCKGSGRFCLYPYYSSHQGRTVEDTLKRLSPLDDLFPPLLSLFNTRSPQLMALMSAF